MQASGSTQALKLRAIATSPKQRKRWPHKWTNMLLKLKKTSSNLLGFNIMRIRLSDINLIHLQKYQLSVIYERF